MTVSSRPMLEALVTGTLAIRRYQSNKDDGTSANRRFCNQPYKIVGIFANQRFCNQLNKLNIVANRQFCNQSNKGRY